jgi:nitrogen regulatory protein PII
MWKANGKTTTQSLPETETNVRCFLWRQNNPEVNYSPIRISGGGGVFLGETPGGKSYSEEYRQKQKMQKEHHSFKIGTWNVRTLNQGGKLENLKKEMQKNAVSVLGVTEVRWKGQGEIRSGDYTVYYSRGDRAERGVEIVVHKSVVKSVVKKSCTVTESLLLS